MDYTKEELQKSPLLSEEVFPEGPLKQMILDYVGHTLQPENEMVTVEMIIEVMAQEFPEFIMALAEENFLRGYQQAADDFENYDEKYKEKLANELITNNGIMNLADIENHEN